MIWGLDGCGREFKEEKIRERARIKETPGRVGHGLSHQALAGSLRLLKYCVPLGVVSASSSHFQIYERIINRQFYFHP